jgi:hypothetical protein
VNKRDSAKTRNYGIKRRRRFQALGLCTRCGGEKQRFDRKSCDSCLELMRLKEGARLERVGPGVCSHCRTNHVEGKRLCAPCKAKVNSQVFGWMTHVSKIAKAAEALVLASEYVNRNLSVEDMERARGQAAKSMKRLFRAVHELQQRRTGFKARAQQTATWRRAA